MPSIPDFPFTSMVKIFLLASISKDFNDKTFNLTYAFKGFMCQPGTPDNFITLALSGGHCERIDPALSP